jgi:hypothetical protein
MSRLGSCVRICDGCVAGPPHTCAETGTTCLDMEDAWKEGWEKGMAHAIGFLERLAKEKHDGRTLYPLGGGIVELRRVMGWEGIRDLKSGSAG